MTGKERATAERSWRMRRGGELTRATEGSAETIKLQGEATYSGVRKEKVDVKSASTEPKASRPALHVKRSVRSPIKLFNDNLLLCAILRQILGRIVQHHERRRDGQVGGIDGRLASSRHEGFSSAWRTRVGMHGRQEVGEMC